MGTARKMNACIITTRVLFSILLQLALAVPTSALSLRGGSEAVSQQRPEVIVRGAAAGPCKVPPPRQVPEVVVRGFALPSADLHVPDRSAESNIFNSQRHRSEVMAEIGRRLEKRRSWRKDEKPNSACNKADEMEPGYNSVNARLAAKMPVRAAEATVREKGTQPERAMSDDPIVRPNAHAHRHPFKPRKASEPMRIPKKPQQQRQWPETI